MRRYGLPLCLVFLILLDFSMVACERPNPNAARIKDLFLSQSDYPVGTNPTTVNAVDLNHDGNLDLITTNVETIRYPS